MNLLLKGCESEHCKLSKRNRSFILDIGIASCSASESFHLCDKAIVLPVILPCHSLLNHFSAFQSKGNTKGRTLSR